MGGEVTDFPGRIGAAIRVHKITQHNPRSWWGAAECGISGLVRAVDYKAKPRCQVCYPPKIKSSEGPAHGPG